LQASILLGDVTGSSFSSGTDLGGVMVVQSPLGVPSKKVSGMVFVPVFGSEHLGKKHVLTVLKQSAFVKSIVLRTSFQGVGVPVAMLFPPSRSKPTPTSSGEA